MIKKIAVLFAIALASGRTAAAQASPPAHTPLADSLIALEMQSWDAWQKRDGDFYKHFLSDDHIEMGGSGRSTKDAVVGFVGSPICVVTSYSLDSFEVKVLAPGVAAVTYHADQKTVCNKNPVPAPVWVTSLYVLRSGRWQNAIYQQTKTP